MSAQHTPGPWAIHVPMTGDGLVIEAKPSVEWHRVASVNVPGYASRFDEMRANARLIAAAPELLEALRTLWTVVEMTGGQPTQSGLMDAAKDKVRAALAKVQP